MTNGASQDILLYDNHDRALVMDTPVSMRELEAASSSAVKKVNASLVEGDEEGLGFSSPNAGQLLHFNIDATLLRSHTMYYLHPLIGRIIDIITDFVLGDGIQFYSKDSSVNQICREFWEHPINRLDEEETILTRDHFMYGETFVPVFVDENEKDVTLGSTHPYIVDRTYCDPGNPRTIIGVGLKGSEQEIMTTLFSPDLPDYKLFSKAAIEMRQNFSVIDYESGDRVTQYCMVNQLNQQQADYGAIVQSDIGGAQRYASPFKDYQRNVSRRGSPELLALFDPLLSADSILSSMVERADAATRILWDVTYTGATKTMCDRYAADTPLPDKYTVLVHNERIKWNRVDAASGATEMVDLYKAVRNYALSGRGCGFPEHWFTEGGQTNLATARKMEIAPLKRLRQRRKMVLKMFKKLLQYQVSLKGYNPALVEMVSPPMSQTELHEIALALTQITTSLIQGQTANYISEQEAAAIFRGTLMEFPGSEALHLRDENRKVDDSLINDLRQHIVDEYRAGESQLESDDDTETAG